MKKIYTLMGLVLLTAASCKKSFIDLAPKSSYSDQNYYQTDAQFGQATTAAYAGLRDVVTTDYLFSEMRSDNTIYQSFLSNRGTAYTDREKLSDFMDPSTDSYTATEWQDLYLVISRANIVISRLKTASGIPDASVKSYDGQCKFLRALMYFKLVRLFGGVPLFLNEVRTPEDAFLPRSSADDVYKQIIADATDAMTELPVPTKFPQTGAATKGAATVLLADVYVTQKRWAEAETLLNSLSTMGYSLNANYSDAFLPANKNNKESLFEVQFLDGTTTGSTPNPLCFHFLPRSKNTSLITTLAIDNTTTGGWNTPTQDLISNYEAGDKRLDASIGVAEGVYDGSNYFTYSAVKSIVGYTTPPSGKTAVPYCKKYEHTPAAITGSADDFPIYRYSEALLLLAEAQNEQGKSPLTALNTVRARAGLAPVTSADQTTLRNTILHERRVELAFENKRWHDLTRTGNALTVMNAFGVKLKTQISYISADSYIVTNDKLLFPLPQAEVGLNTQLTQNPGY
ncbi:RagB/SusD family nutrient uptake outer membrane protein [Mucilaginibacter jinjuensis]|uniref:RagB/SusD family nutrient uptake outer membrane protein n=1 Tax=Mucilaginibacter jinjuensis TaxID=1176721 RepID=A0ABY7TEN6_9SPHI|nr:RagB/SusD family nutrient uptake outer membrane protein [Mucilaginibacter jinjuensis]WCT14500.1 RagB/SusD family nutrient uptake outer membrane protein [Mucilaginibacter jinjuensis]